MLAGCEVYESTLCNFRELEGDQPNLVFPSWIFQHVDDFHLKKNTEKRNLNCVRRPLSISRELFFRTHTDWARSMNVVPWDIRHRILLVLTSKLISSSGINQNRKENLRTDEHPSASTLLVIQLCRNDSNKITCVLKHADYLWLFLISRVLRTKLFSIGIPYNCKLK